MYSIFKRSLFIIIWIFVLTFTVKVKASSAYFVWENTIIDIPINTPLDQYKNNYKLTFYVNGKPSDDYEVEMEVNCSTFSTVLTTKLGKYTVYYKAYSETHYVSSIQAIIFNVIDVTSPKITPLTDLVTLEHGEELILSDWFKITDDTSDSSNLTITLKDQNVLYNLVGTYDAKIIVSDNYDNISELEFKICVIDKQKPEILILKPLVINCGEEVNITEYFKATDNCSGDISSLICISGIDTNKIGVQEINVSVTDFSNNTTTIKVTATIVDKKSPDFVLEKNDVTLDIAKYSEYDYNFFRKYILDLSDNFTIVDNINIEIDMSKLKEEVSDYEINYVITDENGNKSSEKLIVKLRELVGPEIVVEPNIRIKVGEQIDLYSIVEVYDAYDREAKTRLSILDNNLNINVAGNYNVTYICYNNSGKYTTKTVTVEVIDNSLINQTENNYDDNNNIIDKLKTKIDDEMILKVVLISLVIVFVLTIFKRNKNK